MKNITSEKWKTYAEWSEEYPNYLVLLRAGYYYSSWGKSAEVLNEVLGYNLSYSSKRKVPFTGGTNLDNITNALNRNNINYIVIEYNEITEQKEYKYCNETFYDINYFPKDKRKIRVSNEEILETAEALLNGIDPYTGEILDKDNLVYYEKVQALILLALKSAKRAIHNNETKPECAGKKWTNEEVEKLKEEYERNIPVDEIAKIHNRTISGIQRQLIKMIL